MTAALVAGIFTLAGAIISAAASAAFQNWRDRQERTRRREADRRDQQLRVISDLVAYRFVLTEKWKEPPPEALTSFNSALSRVPIEFIDSQECIELYRNVGKDFTVQKFYDLIVALLNVAAPEQNNVDVHLLNNVPTAGP